MSQYITSLQKDLRLGTTVDTVYANAQNLMKQRADVRPFFGRYVQSFSTLSTGGAAGIEFALPTNSLLGGVAISFKLPDHGVGGANYTRHALPRGWGYALIRAIRVSIGGSTPIEVYGPQHALSVLRQADTAHKRAAIWSNGGKECLSLAEFQGDNLQAYVHLDLPFSKISTLSQKLPFDASLLSAPIRIHLDLNPLASVICGDGVGASLPTQFEKAYFILSKEFQFVNPAHSLRETLMADGAAVYNYPFLHSQSRAPILLPAGAASYSVQLNGFETGQVLAIVLALEYGMRDKTSTACKPGALALMPMRNIELTYGGQQLYNAPDGIASLFELEHDTMPGAFEDSQIRYADDTNHASGFISSPVSSRYYVIQMSQFNEKIFSEAHGLYQYGPDIGANTLQLRFSPGYVVPAEGCQLHLTYVYNAMLLCNQGNAKAEILP